MNRRSRGASPAALQGRLHVCSRAVADLYRQAKELTFSQPPTGHPRARCSAQRCTADTGSRWGARGLIPDLRRITTCCGASGMMGGNIGWLVLVLPRPG
jgi:hypothetical protein